MSTAERIRDIVTRQLGEAAPAAGLGVDDDLWAAGMTSLQSVGIMLAVEDAFDVELPDEDLTRERFATCRGIADAVARALAAGGPDSYPPPESYPPIGSGPSHRSPMNSR